MGQALVEHLDQLIGDYVLQIAVALVVVASATALWIMSRRRRYVKSAELSRVIEALRLEVGRSIDETRAVTAKKTAAVSHKLFSAIKPIETRVADLNVRLARLDEHADSVEAFMSGTQKDVLQETEQVAVRLGKLEQRLIALSDQVSFIQQTIDGASQRDQDRLEAIKARLISTEKQVDDLLPRLELGDKAREDLGGIISLFVKQLKRVNIYSTETTVRVAELESLRPKVSRLEELLGATLDRESHPSGGKSTTNAHNDLGDAPPKAGGGVGAIEANSGSPSEEQPTLTADQAEEPSLTGSSFSDDRSVTGANGHVATGTVCSFGLAPAVSKEG